MSNNLGDVAAREGIAQTPWLIEVSPDGRTTHYSFARMQHDADAFAQWLGRAGLARGARVGVLASNSASNLIAGLGIMRAGLVVVPINFKLPAATIEHIIADAQIGLLLVDAQHAGLAGSGDARIVDIDEAVGQARSEPPHGMVAGQAASMAPDEFAMILYTSGSTGLPKGVPLTHGGYVWVIRTLARISPPFLGKRALFAAPLYHMNAVIQCLLTSSMGGTNVMLCKFDARQYLEVTARLRCDMVTAVPTMFALACRESDLLGQLDFRGVASVKSGSAPVTEALLERLAGIFPNAVVSNWWGTTESGPLAFGPHPRGLVRPRLSLGYPLDEVEMELRDGSSPDEGELWIRSRAVAPGYLNRPEQSRSRFVGGWYVTGDVMRRDEAGFYYFVGRVDDMFVCGGENIYPGEVEKMLERHTGIAQAVVIAVDDEIKGQIPAAFIVCRPGASLTAGEVRAFALKHAPAYQHPRFVEFLAEMPLAGTNKIDRQALAQRARTFSR